jgi:hypothetical protein
MILIGENGSAGRRTCSNVTLSTIHASWTNLGLILGSCHYNPAIKNLNHAKPVEFMDIHLNRLQNLGILMHSKR